MRKFLPPQLTVICLVVMAAAYLFVPSATLIASRANFAAGVTLAVLGIFVAVGAKQQFQKAQTTVYTFDQPETLITSGWFAKSRNPMYVGLLLVLVGATLGFGNWLTAFGPVAFFLLAQHWYIPFEEEMGRATFGDAYVAYSQSVRRWL